MSPNITILKLNEILYIINEKNYNKNLIEFKEGYMKLSNENYKEKGAILSNSDLKIEGEFEFYNQLINDSILNATSNVSISAESCRCRR